MQELKPETVLPALAVSAWKHRAFVAAQAAVVRLALEREWRFGTGAFSPGDLPEDTVSAADKQGVLSNCWNMLRALEIIERLPLNYCNEAEGIFGGRIKNKRGSAKGRWTAAYRLRSKALAEEWLRRHGYEIKPPQRIEIQLELTGG